MKDEFQLRLSFFTRLYWFVFSLHVISNTSRSVTGINFSFRITLVSLYTQKHNQYQDYIQDFNSFTGHDKEFVLLGTKMRFTDSNVFQHQHSNSRPC